MSEMCNATGFGFSEALTWLRNGYRVARKGWNGKNMCIYLTEESDVPFHKMKPAVQEALISCRSEELHLDKCEPCIHINPHIDLVCADGSITCGWVASQTDMTAKDWMIVQ